MKSLLFSLGFAALGALPLGCLGAAISHGPEGAALVPRKGEWKFTQVPDFFTWSREMFANRDIPQSIPDDFWINEDKKYDEAGFDEGDGENSGRTKWARLGAYLRQLNARDPDRVQYRLLYLMRHGRSYHNIHPYPWAGHPAGSPELAPYVDDLLIPEGVEVARRTGAAFAARAAGLDMPLPDAFVTSPLRRAVQTAAYAFAGVGAGARGGGFYSRRATVMENLRPRTDDLPWQFRSSRATIEACVGELGEELLGGGGGGKGGKGLSSSSSALPFGFERGFAAQDPFAGRRGEEDEADRVERYGRWLAQIFSEDEHRGSTVLAVVTHRKTIQGIDRAAAGGRKLVNLQPPNSGVIPMVIKATR